MAIEVVIYIESIYYISLKEIAVMSRRKPQDYHEDSGDEAEEVHEEVEHD